jgi:serine/threonine-protein kinase
MENYVGKRLDGRYEIRDVIGVGGMAVVYKAYDNIDDRIVAVKILKDEYLANEEFRRRFKNESKAIAVLSHRNIVKVYDVSFGDRLQYIVMEYIEGITLKEYIEEHGVINWNEALFFSIQILRALQHAHDKGIVHRDVKPQNIMLLENGTIKVTDFGIARFSHSETKTMTEKAIGSVHYISPEQAKGELTDEKADIYSVGVVLYEMLTGKLPFEAESAVSVALMQVNNEPELPRTINSRIPMGFEQITMKAMQKSTKERYQTAAEMLLDLEELKRNPNIKFDYLKYYVDDTPTKYIGKIQGNKQVADTQPTGEYERVKTVPPVADARKKLDDSQRRREVNADREKKEKKTKNIAIVAGVGVAIAVFALVFGFISLLTGGRKIEVADFKGMTYDEIVANKDKYKDYDFEVIYEQFSDGKENCVFKQDPEAGTKAKKGVTVRLYIAKSGEGQIIPDFTDQNYMSVCDTLESMGFVAKAVPVTDSEKPVGNVVYTDPAAGSSVFAGSNITVYYSASSSSGTLFDMPDVVGMDFEAAEKVLIESGLKVGEKKTVDSSKPENQVVSQSIEKGTPVQAGDEVILTVSSGRSTAEIEIDLPSNAGDVSVKVMLDDKVVSTESVNTDVITDYRISVPGDSSSGVVKIYLNEKLYYEVKVDYSKSPAKLSGEKYHPVSFYINVVGMDVVAAENALKKAGYNNISIVEVVSTQKANTVISQSPTQSSAPNLDKTATIVLNVAVSQSMDESTTGV